MKNISLYLFLSLVVTLVLVPLVFPGFFMTDDGNWMIIRLSAFYQSLAEGQFPVRFLGRLNYSYGYPVANFLYPGFLYAGSLIHYSGFNFVDTTKMLIILSVSGCAILTYLWLRIYFSVKASVLGTSSLVASPYMLFDIYKRGSVGELFAMPWIALGLYSIGSGKKALFPVAVFLLIIGHNSLAFLFLFFFIFYLISAGKLKDFIVPGLIGVGMSAFFWIPALHDQKYVQFSNILVSVPADYFLKIQTLWLIGLPFLAAIYSLFRVKKHHSQVYVFLTAYLIGVILTLPISRFIWNIRIISSLFQFPFRFLALTIFSGSWLVGYSANQKVLPVWFIPIVVTGLLMQLWLGLGQVQHEYHPEGYYTTNEATTTVADEYLSKWVTRKPEVRANSKVEFHQGSGVFTPLHVSTQYIEGSVEATDDSIIQINTLYFPGWGVTLDGILTKLDYQNPLGVMRVRVPKGTHLLVASFRETVTRFIADIMTLASGVWYIVYLYNQRRIHDAYT